jgi:hypothetical protein
MLDADAVMKLADETFIEAVAAQHPYTAPECLPTRIPSRQVRALCKALCTAINTEFSQ